MAVIALQGNNYDSYITHANAGIYITARIGSPEWSAASQTVQFQSLITATRWINRLLQRITDETLIPDPSVDPAPSLIQDATIEAAYALIVDSTIQDKVATTSNNDKIIQAGSVKLERFRPESGTALPTIAQQLVNEWIADVGASTITAGAAFGTLGLSEFNDADRFSRNEGLA